jgi:hypothetical protein
MTVHMIQIEVVAQWDYLEKETKNQENEWFNRQQLHAYTPTTTLADLDAVATRASPPSTSTMSTLVSNNNGNGSPPLSLAALRPASFIATSSLTTTTVAPSSFSSPTLSPSTSLTSLAPASLTPSLASVHHSAAGGAGHRGSLTSTNPAILRVTPSGSHISGNYSTTVGHRDFEPDGHSTNTISLTSSMVHGNLSPLSPHTGGLRSGLTSMIIPTLLPSIHTAPSKMTTNYAGNLKMADSVGGAATPYIPSMASTDFSDVRVRPPTATAAAAGTHVGSIATSDGLLTVGDMFRHTDDALLRERQEIALAAALAQVAQSNIATSHGAVPTYLDNDDINRYKTKQLQRKDFTDDTNNGNVNPNNTNNNGSTVSGATTGLSIFVVGAASSSTTMTTSASVALPSTTAGVPIVPSVHVTESTTTSSSSSATSSTPPSSVPSSPSSAAAIAARARRHRDPNAPKDLFPDEMKLADMYPDRAYEAALAHMVASSAGTTSSSTISALPSPILSSSMINALSSTNTNNTNATNSITTVAGTNNEPYLQFSNANVMTPSSMSSSLSSSSSSPISPLSSSGLLPLTASPVPLVRTYDTPEIKTGFNLVLENELSYRSTVLLSMPTNHVVSIDVAVINRGWSC